MASVALTSLTATLKLEFLQPNPRLCLDDDEASSKSIKSLLENLSSLQAFVHEKSGELERKIRDFALEAEDRIEIQLSNFLLANNREDQQKASQKLSQTLREAAENAAELLNISKEADELEEEEVVNESLPILWLKHASSAPEPSNFMAGRRRDHILIMSQLLRVFDGLKLISIVGMPGIGKTTLAASLFGDPSVTSYFDVQGWVTMSGKYNKTQTLNHLLRTLAEADDDEIEKGSILDDDLAAEQLYKCLKGKRYLIVLDNLWNNQAWYDIRPCLPDEHNGSRILLTTTHFSRDYFASYGYVHNMTLLNPKESWDLFCNNPFFEQHMAPKCEKIRSQVVEKCEGLPHSIVVVARRLSKYDNIQQEWKKVEKEMESLGVLDSRALTITYNQLPQHLKVCFLYFGVFPKRSAIKVKLLISLWIVEGFIKPLEHKELENQAYEYLQEFIDRSLILMDNWSSGGNIKTCRMHSALHSFCIREAKKEGLFCALNTRQLPRGSLSMFANSCRWLSLHTHSFDYYVLFKTNNPRSIFFFQEDDEVFVSFKLLRVLAFVPSSFLQRVPTRLHDLVFLRYLSVSEWFEGLDYVVSTNRNLQTLVVSSKESQLGAPTLHLPSTLWESPQLQHLELDNSYAIDPPTIAKENMQTLSWVCPTQCREEVYRKFPNIKKLKIFVFCTNPFTLDNLQHLERLERLSISVSFGCVVTLSKPSMFPSQLKKLWLSGTKLSKGDLMVISMLPRLEVLKLENAFHSKEWKVAKGGFPRLKFLLLEDNKLDLWTADEDSFRCIKHLVLRFCYYLYEIPEVMENIATLESIELDHCRGDTISSAEHILESQRDWGNEILELKIKGREYNESDVEESSEDESEDSIASDAE